MQTTEILAIAQKTLQIEAEAIHNLISQLTPQFVDCTLKIKNLQNNARTVLTGIGKSAIIAQKIAATFNSTGTSALFMHAADAIHGDLGMIQPNDILIVVSKSGETPEIKALIPIIKTRVQTLIAIVGNPRSYLAQNATHVLNTYVTQEACPNNLAPTASTTAQLAMGDALAVCVLHLKGFTNQDFAYLHPGGILGKQLYLTVNEIVIKNKKTYVYPHETLKNIIINISSSLMGAVAVINPQHNTIEGIITDGDLRRLFEKYTDNPHFFETTAQQIMTPNCKTIDLNELAINALQIIRNNKINQLVVINASQNNSFVGMVHLHNLIQEGLI